jgi:Fic family protein
MDETYKYASKRIKWYNRDLNEAIFSQPYIKAKTVGEVMKKSSRTTITKYMGELVSEGIVSSRKDGLEVYYLNDDLIRILSGN